MVDVLLSSREKKLLRRLASGRSDAQIAREIGGTEKQVAAQRAATGKASTEIRGRHRGGRRNFGADSVFAATT
jgi:hypothetical protein